MFFKHVLIPLDGSELSERVFAPLREVVGRREVGLVTLLRVLEPGDDRLKVEEDLERLGRQLSATVSVSHRLVEGGEASEEILRAADELEPDLLAMATHGRSGLARLIRGSVAERVLRRCTRPLLLWNPTKPGASEERGHFRRIMVPHDGSELADRILEHAGSLARLYGAELILFKVENLATDSPHPALRSEEEVAATLQPLKEDLVAAGVQTVHLRVGFGSEAGEILKAIEVLEIDLLALTTHGRSGASRLWLGSVAEAVLRSASCPVFLLRVRSPG